MYILRQKNLVTQAQAPSKIDWMYGFIRSQQDKRQDTGEPIKGELSPMHFHSASLQLHLFSASHIHNVEKPHQVPAPKWSLFISTSHR